ncbi:hypothetical protein ACA910_010422 [Epithemia clementina (nom. ined.)]
MTTTTLVSQGTARNCVQDLLLLYNQESFQKKLYRLHQDKASHDPEEWAKDLYMSRMHDPNDTVRTKALALDHDRRTCLQFLFHMMNMWQKHNDEYLLPKGYFELAVFQYFQTWRIQNILSVCLVLTRAKVLYSVILPSDGATPMNDGQAIVGSHWFCDLQRQDHQEQVKTIDVGTMDRRLYRLLNSKVLKLQNDPAIARWSKPQAAPLPCLVKSDDKETKSICHFQHLSSNTIETRTTPVEIKEDVPEMISWITITTPANSITPDSTQRHLPGRLIQTKYRHDLHYICGCSNFEPILIQINLSTKHIAASDKTRLISHLVDEGKVLSFVQTAMINQASRSKNTTRSWQMRCKSYEDESKGAHAQTCISLGHNEIFRAVAQKHYRTIVASIRSSLVQGSSTVMVREEALAVVRAAQTVARRIAQNPKAKFRVWKPVTGVLADQDDSKADDSLSGSTGSNSSRHLKNGAASSRRRGRRMKAANWADFSFVEITENEGHLRTMLEPPLRKARALALEAVKKKAQEKEEEETAAAAVVLANRFDQSRPKSVIVG